MDLIVHLFYVYSKWQPPGLKSRSNVKNCNCLSDHLRLTCKKKKKKVNLHELEVKILNFTKFRKGFGVLTAHLLRPQLQDYKNSLQHIGNLGQGKMCIPQLVTGEHWVKLTARRHRVLYQESPCDCFCCGQPYLEWKSPGLSANTQTHTMFAFKMKVVLYPCNHIKSATSTLKANSLHFQVTLHSSVPWQLNIALLPAVCRQVGIFYAIYRWLQQLTTHQLIREPTFLPSNQWLPRGSLTSL